MFNLINKTKVISNEPIKRKYDNSLLAESADKLLSRQSSKILDIKKSLSLTNEIYNQYYHYMFMNIAAMAQCVPASESHHHSHSYGYLDHIFECVVLALRLREGYVYRSEQEDLIMKKKEVYSYAVVAAALCHDLGKLVTDVELYNATKDSVHHLNQGALPEGTEFLFRYYPKRKIEDHKQSGLLLLANVMGESGLSWIQGEPELYREFLHCLCGNYNFAGKLGQIVLKADRHSTSTNLKTISDRFASQRQGVGTVTNHFDNSMSELELGNTAAKVNKNSRASSIAQALCTALKDPTSFGGKGLNVKGSFAWVSKEYIYVVNPRCFTLIETILKLSSSKIQLSQPLICYSILKDAGFIAPYKGDKSYTYLTIDENDWNKKLPLVRFIRNKLDPEFLLPESQMKISDEEAEPELDGDKPEGPVEKQEIKNSASKVNAIKNSGDMTSSFESPVFNEEPPMHNEIPMDGMGSFPDDAQNYEASIADNMEINSHFEVTKGETELINKNLKSERNSALNEFSGQFFKWLNVQFKMRTLDVNKQGAPIHFVDGNMCLMSPIIFKKFIGSNQFKEIKMDESIDLSDRALLKKVQFKIFESNLHVKDVDMKNILSFDIQGRKERKNVYGIMLKPDSVYLITDQKFNNSRNLFLESALMR